MRSLVLVLGSLLAGTLACAAVTPPTAAAKPAPVPARPLKPAAPPRLSEASVARVKLWWDAAVGGKGRAVTLSRRHRRVATATGDGVQLFELETGKPVAALRTCPEVLRAGLHAEGEQLLVVCERAVQRWSLKTGKSLAPVEVADARVTAAAFARGRVALAQDDGVIRVHELLSGAVATIEVPGPPIDVKSLALTPDGARVVVAWVQGSIWWWSVAAPTEPHALVRYPSESDTLGLSDDGAILAEEGKANTTTLWSFGETPRKLQELRGGAWLKRLLFTPDGKWLVRGGSDGLELTELAGNRRYLLEPKALVEDVAFDETQSYLAAVDRAGKLGLWAAR